MKHENYIRSNKPLWVSGIILPIAMLIPILTFVFDGWHSGIPHGVFLAVQVGVFIPGIYLFGSWTFWIWVVLSYIASISGTLTIHHYWNAVPDWMDAEIPKAVTYAIEASIWAVMASSVVLGILGWLKYFRGRRQ